MSYSISIPVLEETEVKTDSITIAPPLAGEEIWTMEGWTHHMYVTEADMESPEFKKIATQRVKYDFMEFLDNNPDFFDIQYEYDPKMGRYSVGTRVNIMKRQRQ